MEDEWVDAEWRLDDGRVDDDGRLEDAEAGWDDGMMGGWMMGGGWRM